MRMKKMNQNRFSLVCFSVTRPTYLHQECPCRRRLAVPTEAPPAESSTTASSKVGSPFAPQGRDLPSLSALSLSLFLLLQASSVPLHPTILQPSPSPSPSHALILFFFFFFFFSLSLVFCFFLSLSLSKLQKEKCKRKSA